MGMPRQPNPLLRKPVYLGTAHERNNNSEALQGTLFPGTGSSSSSKKQIKMLKMMNQSRPATQPALTMPHLSQLSMQQEPRRRDQDQWAQGDLEKLFSPKQKPKTGSSVSTTSGRHASEPPRERNSAQMRSNLIPLQAPDDRFYRDSVSICSSSGASFLDRPKTSGQRRRSSNKQVPRPRTAELCGIQVPLSEITNDKYGTHPANAKHSRERSRGGATVVK